MKILKQERFLNLKKNFVRAILLLLKNNLLRKKYVVSLFCD